MRRNISLAKTVCCLTTTASIILTTLISNNSKDCAVSCTKYMDESFDDGEKWSDRWILSEWKSTDEIGKWSHTTGDWSDSATDFGIKTSEDARFYGISAKLSQVFDNHEKDLVISYLVKHEQSIDCGGAYIKLLPKSLDQSKFGGDSPYSIMFGPDICGGTKKTHAILNYQRKKGSSAEMEAKNMDFASGTIKAENDVHAHLYTYIIKKDNTFEVKIDNEIVKSGSLEDHWPFLPPSEIEDPEESKPTDWVDEQEIVDPEDVKPAGYDFIPASIVDPSAVKPEDWEDEDDGEWEPPMIDNPDFQGEWEAKSIPNPEYKGEWVHPKIANPDSYEDENLHARCADCEYVGFELWQVKSGTLIDDILISDDLADEVSHAEKVMAKIEALKAVKIALDEEEEKKKEAEAEDEKAVDEEEDEDEESVDKDEL